MHSTAVRNQKLTKTAQVLLYFFAFADFLPRPFESKTRYFKRSISGKSNSFTSYKILKRLEERGSLKIFKDGTKNLYALTAKGKLEAIFIKARIPERKAWDGKWRMVIFDIPEGSRSERHKLRSLLKSNGFKQVQKSVFINPWPLNHEAIVYLRETGLNKFIRVFRVDDADNQADLKKMFAL